MITSNQQDLLNINTLSRNFWIVTLFNTYLHGILTFESILLQRNMNKLWVNKVVIKKN